MASFLSSTFPHSHTRHGRQPAAHSGAPDLDGSCPPISEASGYHSQSQTLQGEPIFSDYQAFIGHQTNSQLKCFRNSKPESSNFVTSLDFNDQGEHMVAACDDETIQIFDVKEGKSTKMVPSKKYGVHLARFTHHPRQVLHASTKVDRTFLMGFQNSNFNT